MKTTDKTVKFVVDVENNFVKVLQFAICITHCCVFLFSRLKVRCSVCNNNNNNRLSPQNKSGALVFCHLYSLKGWKLLKYFLILGLVML